jgi:hypothetical protein
VVLTAIGTVTGPGPHHIKLAIADSGDAILDSNVFIQADSLVIGTGPTCISPTPAIELGFAPLTADPGDTVAFDVLSVSNGEGAFAQATIAGVRAERAPSASTGCGSFATVPLPAAVQHTPGLPVMGQPATVGLTWTPIEADAGCWHFVYELSDETGKTASCTIAIHVSGDKGPPPPPPGKCPGNTTLEVWPPNHEYVPIDVFALLGDTEAGDLPQSFAVTRISQDEPVDSFGEGHTSCDGWGIGSRIAWVRAERSGKGDGRVYVIEYTFSPPDRDPCKGEVRVSVPKAQNGKPALDSNQRYESTAGCP